MIHFLRGGLYTFCGGEPLKVGLAEQFAITISTCFPYTVLPFKHETIAKTDDEVNKAYSSEVS